MKLCPLATHAAAVLVATAALSFPPVLRAQAPEPPVSRIPVVFKTSWPALVALADSAIPKCVGQPPLCQSDKASNYILRHDDDWFVVGTILRREIGWKGGV